MTSTPVRVRIAPSPTGYFHVGTARTAIYNYLFARQHRGTFVLRIEDTDLDRSEKEYVDVILDGLKWLGLKWDEGPIHQAERQALYRPYVQQLLESGRAYRCYCTPDELEAERSEARAAKLDWKYSRRCRNLSTEERARRETEGRPAAVRLAVPQAGSVYFDDLVAGRLSRDHADIEDFVIARSDGRALYNFAVVVDDHLMEITHVIRGNDHITNTYKQLLIYAALEWTPPAFAHVPLILRPDKSKVSKRKGDPSVTDYRTCGYLPESLLNYLCLLGWSPGDDREIFSTEELVEAFELERVSGANPIFDPAKLEWMNGEYIRALPTEAFAEVAVPFVVDAGLAGEEDLRTHWERFVHIAGLLQERCKVLADFARLGAYFFKAPTEYEARGVERSFGAPGAAERLRAVAGAWRAQREFTAEALEAALQTVARELGVKNALLIHPTRLALTGLTGGPGLYQLATLLGSAECETRLERAASAIETGQVTVRIEEQEESAK